jgi:hypothetical protein
MAKNDVKLAFGVSTGVNRDSRLATTGATGKITESKVRGGGVKPPSTSPRPKVAPQGKAGAIAR